MDTPRHRALASASRVAILRLVRATPAGLTTGEVATASGLHLSTARAHLDRLVGAGLLVRQRDGGGAPGRPAWRYLAASPDPAPPPYRALAAALLSHLADTDYDVWETAVRAGEGWGLRLAAIADKGDPVMAVVRALEGLGFAPRVVTTCPATAEGAAESGRPRPQAGYGPQLSAGQAVRTGKGAGSQGVEIRLRTCPFLELVADHAETMCGLHLGVVRGVLAGSGAPDTDATLMPFGAADACVLRLIDKPRQHA